MVHLLYRQKVLKTLAFFVLLQYMLLKKVLFSGEKGIFAFYVRKGHILSRIEEGVDFKKIEKRDYVKFFMKFLMQKEIHLPGIGRTSSKENYCGYLQSFAYDHPRGIFTACCLEAGDTFCSKLFADTYEAHKKNVGRAPEEISLDKGYDEIKVREVLEKDKTKVYISLVKRDNKYGVYSTEMFEFNEEGELKEAIKKRLRIEAGIGHLKDYHLLRRALYRNKEMIRIQQLISVTSSNIEKLVWAKASIIHS